MVFIEPDASIQYVTNVMNADIILQETGAFCRYLRYVKLLSSVQEIEDVSSSDVNCFVVEEPVLRDTQIDKCKIKLKTMT